MADPLLAGAVAIAAGLFCWLATGALIPILRKLALLDHPNYRSSHSVPTPRGGGIAVTGSVLLVWLVLHEMGWVAPSIIGIALGGGFLAAISWIDDIGGLSPGVRLVAQAAAVTIGMLALPEPRGLLEAGLGPRLYLAAAGVLWIWWINLFNFMDGIDGLAASESAAIGGGLLLFAGIGEGRDATTALLAAGFGGAAIGFLLWNWSPARIFLGDVGSIPLGYLSGFLLLGVATQGYWRVALILPLYFLADATITLCCRLLRGEQVWQAHRQHFYQRAVRAGFGHAGIVERVAAANLLLIGCGWAAENGWGMVALGAAVATVAALLAALASEQ